jgi:hypothetical protein
MFGSELVAPVLIFLPRRLRHLAFWILVTLQIFIALTGNYGFFNLLTLLLCFTLLDDFALKKLIRFKLPRFERANQALSKWRWPRWITIPLLCLVAAVSLLQARTFLKPNSAMSTRARSFYAWLSPFRTFNTYGLFAVMTTVRREIIVEGSHDGAHWVAYEFKHKPGHLARRPGFVAPHQPRLDWQMWFAALGDSRQNPWFVNFCVRLLQGSLPVVDLLDKNPFPAKPPRYVRAVMYEYHFTDMKTRRQTGAWWRRELIGNYLPPISLDSVTSNREAAQ